MEVGGLNARGEWSFEIAWHESFGGAKGDESRDDFVNREMCGSVVFGGGVPGSWKVDSKSVSEVGGAFRWFGVPMDGGVMG
jgi:hypothetical protein